MSNFRIWKAITLAEPTIRKSRLQLDAIITADMKLRCCALLQRWLLTFFFLLIILGATDKRAPQGFAPIAIGFGLTLIHLIGIPVTNLSVNPARSTGPALFVGGWALQQLWMFWVAPFVGAILAGLVYPVMAGKPADVSGR